MLVVMVVVMRVLVGLAPERNVEQNCFWLLSMLWTTCTWLAEEDAEGAASVLAT